MASELSKLIEDELDKVEGANRKDERSSRFSSLRVKVRRCDQPTFKSSVRLMGPCVAYLMGPRP